MSSQQPPETKPGVSTGKSLPLSAGLNKKLNWWLAVVTVYAVIVYLLTNKSAESMLEAAGSVVGTVTLSILLVFRTNAAYDRWWEGRKLWGELVNNIRNLAIKTDAFVKNGVPQKRVIASDLEEFPFLLRDHLRAEAAPAAQAPSPASGAVHAPLACAGRVIGAIQSLRAEGIIDGFQQMQMDNHAAALMDVCGACERIKNTPVVPSYRVISRLGIELNILAMPWLLVPELHAWSILVEVVSAYFLIGLEIVAETIENPFSTGPDHLPLSDICRGIKASVAQVFAAGSVEQNPSL